MPAHTQGFVILFMLKHEEGMRAVGQISDEAAADLAAENKAQKKSATTAAAAGVTSGATVAVAPE